MIRWLRSLIGLCNHEWEIKNASSHDYVTSNEFWYASGTITKVLLQCNKCGSIKIKKFK